jgi:hypothetical protein
MPSVFPRWTNKIPLVLMVATPVLGGVVCLAIWYYFSPSFTDVGYSPKQPVPFSHKLHAGELALDCRYCHSSVEEAAMAAIPPTSVCMNCHKQVKKDSRHLAKVRESHDTGIPLEWTRVHMLPDYAYFDHSVHVAAAVGCVECHGRVDTMEVVRQSKPLSMGWCLDCHRDPQPRLRPPSELTNMTWADETYDPSADLARRRAVKPPTHCSGCHR